VHGGSHDRNTSATPLQHWWRSPSPAATVSPQRLVQVFLGLAWLVDGALQLQPFMFGHGFVAGMLLPAAQGNPAPVAGSITAMAHFLEPHIALWNALFALTQVAIGLGLLVQRTVRPALAVSFAWSLAVWWFTEGLGGLLTGAASPLDGAPGAVLWVGSAALLLRPGNSSGPSLRNALIAARAGQPGWYAGMLTGAARVLGSHGTLLTFGIAAEKREDNVRREPHHRNG